MDSLEITCPHCWETITIEAPFADSHAVEFTCDCEVCCRPIAVRLSWTNGSDLPPEVTAEPES